MDAGRRTADNTRRSVALRTTPHRKAKRRRKFKNGKRGNSQAEAGRNPAITGEAGLDFDADIVSYIAMAVSLIERRHVSENEIIAILARAMRQHRIARRRRIDYLVVQLKKNGP